MPLKWRWKPLGLAAGTVAALAILGLAGIQLYIRWEVASTGDEATRLFGGGRVEALAKLIQRTWGLLPRIDRLLAAR